MLNRVVLVTGGASGIGRAIAVKFASRGSFAVIVDIDKSKAREVVETIHTGGGQADAFVVDVSVATEVKSLMENITQKRGRIDVLINNAYWMKKNPIDKLSEDDWDKTISVSLKGVFLCCKYALPLMGRGSTIINISSIYGFMGAANNCAYATAKGGIIQLTRSLAIELSKKGIRVNCICPGMIETPSTQPILRSPGELKKALSRCLLGRIGKPEDIANVAYVLTTEEAEFMTGAVIVVDSGWSLI